ncbi:hemicentin-1 [Bactrocera oleae]|uniref:hemicentin-1 n=1 Tax=Bactrocera oleae TaxID=104688 RepID=UPI00387E4217
MEKMQRPRNMKDNNLPCTSKNFSYYIGSTAIENTDNIQAVNDFNSNCNFTNHHQINKNMNSCKIVFVTWKYLLAFILFSALLESNSTMAKSQDAAKPLTETKISVLDSLSTTAKTAFPQNTTTTQSILTAAITKDLAKSVYELPSSTPSVAKQSTPISLPSTVATKQPLSASDVLLKGFSLPTFIPPLSPFAIDEFTAYSSATPSLKALTSSMTSETPDDQLYIAAYQQNRRRPNFSVTTKNITVQLGNHAYLPCNIPRILNKPISWLRLRDGHILSVDQATFISDQRFQSIFQGQSDSTWSLQIKYVQESDEGWYECQVPTEPKMSAKIYLGVVVPHTELIGDRNRFVKTGSRVALHCIVRDTLEPPTYIIWFRGKTQITNDNEQGWYTEIDRTIFGNADSSSNTIGSLIIPCVRKQDSDTYTCEPSNSAAVTVDLHVLSGEYSASAIMSAAGSYRLSKSIFTCHFSFLLLLQAMGKT